MKNKKKLKKKKKTFANCNNEYSWFTWAVAQPKLRRKGLGILSFVISGLTLLIGRMR